MRIYFTKNKRIIQHILYYYYLFIIIVAQDQCFGIGHVNGMCGGSHTLYPKYVKYSIAIYHVMCRI